MNPEDPKAVIVWIAEDLFNANAPSNNSIRIDTDTNRRSAPSPMELLLLAVGSCAAVDVISILRKKRQKVRQYRIEVSGQRRDKHPRSYKRMDIRHVVTGRNLSANAIEQAIELSETKYCSVAATLRPTVEIFSSFEIIEDPDE